jgi:hypothetical protein
MLHDPPRTRCVLFCLVALVGGANIACGQLPFFPGAEGFGGTFRGSAPAAGWFSNATVYHVTNLNDSGAGSLRNAFVENSSNKIIVFDVAGTIRLTSGSLDIKNLSNYYIAGQSAPGPVTITGDTTQVTHSSNKDNSNVVLRYLTFRKGVNSGGDALTFAGGSNPSDSGRGRNMIFDHVSVSWAEDENLSVANNNREITIQHSLIADATGGSHSYGSLLRTRSDSTVSLHHNLYANNKSRQPRLGSYNGELMTADVRNNVVYNWSDRATYAGGSSEADFEHVDVNYVGNYLIAGPWTNSNATKAFIVDKNTDVEAYQQGNLIDGDNAPGGIANDNFLDGIDTGWGMFQVNQSNPQGTLAQRATPFDMAPVTTQSATEAYLTIVEHVGNSRWGRDAIDTRIVTNLTGFTAPSSGVEPTAPIASELAAVLGAPQIAHPTDWDTDGDGMPNQWEADHGGDLVWNEDFDNDGYINLLEYLNERGEFPATAPIDYVGPTSGPAGRYALISNWKTNDGGLSAGVPWQPSRFDEARIQQGTVVVDAVGQHAGTLHLGPNPTNNATLNLASGWLKVDQSVQVGSDSGSGNLQVAAGATLFSPDVAVNPLGTLGGSGQIVGAVTNSGQVAPGESVGTLGIDGDYTQLVEGSLVMQIESAASYDVLQITGALAAAGTLVVDLGYAPAAGDAFDLLDFASATGGWTLDLPELSGGLGWDSSSLLSTGVLSVVASLADADFDGSGRVDGTDLLTWQRSFGGAGGLAAGDADGNGAINSADLEIWESQFGSRSSVAGVVPELHTFAAGLTLLVCYLLQGPAVSTPWAARSSRIAS